MRRQMESQLPPTAGPSTTTSKGPAANLAARRNAGEVHADPVQEKVVQKLQAIYEQLVAVADHPAPKPGFFARLGLAPAAKPPAGPRGLYVWGPVGRGKSMLMDLFFADVPMARKRRVHFHEFMLEVQDRLQLLDDHFLHGIGVDLAGVAAGGEIGRRAFAGRRRGAGGRG